MLSLSVYDSCNDDTSSTRARTTRTEMRKSRTGIDEREPIVKKAAGETNRHQRAENEGVRQCGSRQAQCHSLVGTY